MKKGFVIIMAAILILLLILFALFMATRNPRQNNSGYSGDTPLVTVDDQDASVYVPPEGEVQIRKYDGQKAAELLLSDEQLCEYIEIADGEHLSFDDITTNEVYAKTNAQILKTSNEYESFLIENDAMHHIARADGAFGITYIDVCDFDDNGIMDIIYAYSYLDDVFTVEIAYFDMTLKNENVLYKYESPEGYSELILEKLSDGIFDVYTTVPDGTDNENVSFIKDKMIAEISAGIVMEYDETEWQE